MPTNHVLLVLSEWCYMVVGVQYNSKFPEWYNKESNGTLEYIAQLAINTHKKCIRLVIPHKWLLIVGYICQPLVILL